MFHQGYNWGFKNINYYLKWKCFRYAFKDLLGGGRKAGGALFYFLPILLGGKQRPKKFLYSSVSKLRSWESWIWSPEAHNCLLFGLMCFRSARDFTEEIIHSLHPESQISSVSLSSAKELIAMVKLFPSFLSHWPHCKARSSQNAACPVCLLMDYLRTPRWLPVCAPNDSRLLLLPQKKDSWNPLSTFPSQILDAAFSAINKALFHCLPGLGRFGSAQRSWLRDYLLILFSCQVSLRLTGPWFYPIDPIFWVCMTYWNTD